MVRWLRRYGPAEVAALLGAVSGAALAAQWWRGEAVTALAGSLGEAVAFYGFLMVRDLRATRAGVPATVRDLLWEFGPAEFVDTLVMRPLAMYLGQRELGSTIGGVIAGKIAADLVFYGLAILSVEVRRGFARADTHAGPAEAAPSLALALVPLARPSDPASDPGPAPSPVPQRAVASRPRPVSRSRPRSRRHWSARR